jgi:integrase/recombinase XerC
MAKKPTKTPPVTVSESPRPLTLADLKHLLSFCDGGAAGVRDTAIFAVLYSAGLRVREICALWVQDWDPGTGLLHVRNNRTWAIERSVRASEGAQEALNRWMAIRGGEPSHPLFCRTHKSGALVGPSSRPLAPFTITYVVRRRSAEAGLEPLTPREIRNSAISAMLDDGYDVSTVKQLTGHRQAPAGAAGPSSTEISSPRTMREFPLSTELTC